MWRISQAPVCMQTVANQVTSVAVSDEEAALVDVFKQHHGDLEKRIAARITPKYRCYLDVKDILQVTYLECFLRIGQFRLDGPGSLFAWIVQCAENNIRDAIRGLNREKRGQRNRRISLSDKEDPYSILVNKLAGSTTTPSRGAARLEQCTIIERKLGALPPDYARVLRLYDLEGHPIEAVAEAMNRSPGAVHLLRRRASDRLRELLGDPGKFFSDWP